MRIVMFLAILLNLLVAKTIQTPFETLESIHFLGKVTPKSFEQKQKWLKGFEKQIVSYLVDNGFKNNIGKLYKKSTNIPANQIRNYKYLSERYTILATNKFDLQQPTLKVMINYLDESYPDYKDMVVKRDRGIEETRKELMQEPLKISQQFFVYKNSYFGFDITFTEQHNPLDNQEGGRLRVGVFEVSEESYLFVEDKLSTKLWLEPKTKQTIEKLKKLILKETNNFYKANKQLDYKYIAKKQEVIASEKLVISAVADDSDSSRVECDSSLTLNNENVTEQLEKIDSYIYKIAPYNDSFKFPVKSEGIAWQSFYWKHKKALLTKRLSKLGEEEKEFVTLLSTFIIKENNQLKKLFVQEEYTKIENLFNKYWNINKTDNKKIENFLLSVDIVDLIALGMR